MTVSKSELVFMMLMTMLDLIRPDQTRPHDTNYRRVISFCIKMLRFYVRIIRTVFQGNHVKMYVGCVVVVVVASTMMKLHRKKKTL